MAVGRTRGKERLGRHIRPILERSGLPVETVATRASCSAHTIYRLLSGDALPSRQRVAAILAVIGATDDERERAWQLYAVADLSPSIAHAPLLPVRYRRFRMDESEASTERTLDTVVVPGLLQTAEYVTAISTGARRRRGSDQWEELAGAERLERQELLTRNTTPLHCHSLISQAALTTMIGSPEIMARQLDHLLNLADLPNVTVQVIPRDFGSHGGLSGPLVLFDFEGDETAAYVESLLGMEAVQDEDAVTAFSAVWADVASAAPSPKRSADMIKRERDMLR